MVTLKENLQNPSAIACCLQKWQCNDEMKLNLIDILDVTNFSYNW